MKKLDKKNIQKILALTPMQEGMLFHYLKTPQGKFYFEQFSLKMSGQIKIRLFEKAWKSVIDANDMLRTLFRWEKLDHPTQVILKNHHLQLVFQDISGAQQDEKENLLQVLKEKDRNQPFDLRDVPFRVTLFKIEDNHYEIVISSHHILYDGWSNGIILKEFFYAYHEWDEGREPLPNLKPSFQEFVTWIQNRDSDKQKEFWKEYLDGFEIPTELPMKRKRKEGGNEVKTNHSIVNSIVFEGDTKEKLDRFTRAKRVTLASVLYASWAVLLQKYCGCDDVVFGTTVSGRSAALKGIEDMVGLFINTIPLRVRTHPKQALIDVVFEIDNILKIREDFESTSLADIQNCCGLKDGASLFDTLVVIENYPIDHRLLPSDSALSIDSYSMFEMTHYDLTLSVMIADKIEIRFDSSESLFEQEAIDKLCRHFYRIVQSMLENDAQIVYEFEMISDEERNRILYDFNNTAAEFPRDKTIHELFEEQAEKTPDHLALIGSTSLQISYRELNERSNRLAHDLIRKGVAPDTIIGIKIERSIEMIIGIFGILKAGGAYLPIGVDYPQERIDYMLKDSQVFLLITHSVGADPRVCPYASVLPVTGHRHPSTSLAYIIYTSGTTGKPKGVAITHLSLVNRLNWMQKKYPLNENDTILQKTTYTFDVSVWEIFWWAIGGAKVCLLISGGEKNPAEITDAIQRHRVTTIHFVPSMLRVLLDVVTDSDNMFSRLSCLKRVFSSGEALLLSHVEQFKRLLNEGSDIRLINLINLYGPTEATIDVSYFDCLKGTERETIPIGKPIDNTRLVVMNKNLHIQPIGISGELGISGIGLARGYLNRPELTAATFSTFLKKGGAKNVWFGRIYKTGDLCRILNDGNIEFLGRIDHQVKIRGFRIELGEIENNLKGFKRESGYEESPVCVTDAVVIGKENTDANQFLCAYFTSNRDIEPHTLRNYLAGILPDYMIPSYFIRLERIPLTVHGKVDRKALPEPDIQAGKGYRAPSHPIEERLTGLWSEVLGIKRDQISIQAGFFELGGNSLVALRLANRLKKEFLVDIPLNAFFKAGTIADISHQIIRSQSRELPDSDKPVTGGMKILLTMNLPYTRVFGGANKSNKCLVEAMAVRGHRLHVLAPALDTPPTMTHDELLDGLVSQEIEVEETHDTYMFTLNGVSVYAVKHADNLREALIAEIKSYQPDWILISSEDPSQLLLRAVHQVSPHNVIYLAHTPQMLPFGPESLYPGKKRTELIGQSAIILTISHFVSDYIRQWSGFETFVHHPPHYGKGDFPCLGSFDNEYIVMINPCQVKGIAIFIALAESFPQFKFAVVPGWGTTPTDTRRLNSLANVTFLKSSSDLDSLFGKVKILLMPSVWEEGFGMTIVDAMVRGIPVIASDRGGIREAKLGTADVLPVKPITRFTHELDENAFPKALIPDQDIEPWKESLQALVSNKELYNEQSKKSREAALRFVSALSVAPLEGYLRHLSDARLEKTASGIKNDPITPVEEQDYYEVSYAQRMLLLIDELNEAFYGYIIATRLMIEGELNSEHFAQACGLGINRHESFRTVFIKVNGEYKQKIIEKNIFGLEQMDLRGYGDRDRDKVMDNITREAITRRFDLAKGPLFRLKLLQLSERQHLLIMAMHHIISDGWSMEVFLDDLFQLYHALSENRPDSQAPLNIQYKDYASWQNRSLHDRSDEEKPDRCYWHEKLSGQLPVLELPLDYPRPVHKTYNGDSIHFRLEPSKTEALFSISREVGASSFMALVSVVKILLHRYTGQEDIILGIPTSGRKHPELENQVGFYINMLPLRDEIKGEDGFLDILMKTKETCLEAYDHDAYPFDKLVEELSLTRDLSHSPLFDVMVDMDHISPGIRENVKRLAQQVGLRIIPYGVGRKATRIASSHDVAFLISEENGELDVTIIYNTDLFMRNRIERMAGHFSRIVASVIRDSGQPIGKIELLTEPEVSQLLYRFNGMNAESGYPRDLVIHEQVEQMVLKHPGRIACINDGEALSYEALNLRANHLAQRLRNHGVMPDQIVGIFAGRSFEATIGILGILKAGAGYLPIVPTFPRERIHYILHDSRMTCLLVGSDIDPDLNEGIDRSSNRVTEIQLGLYSEEFNAVEGNPGGNPARLNRPGDIAYVLYTSGSTGRPKGVIVQHDNVIRLFFTDDSAELFDFTEKDTWSLFHSWCFDLSVWEMYGALFFGGKTVIISEETRNSPRAFLKLLSRESISVLTQTPGAFYGLLDADNEMMGSGLTIRYLVFAGEALSPARLTDWRLKYPGIHFINMYGITETTVHVTYKEVGETEIEFNIGNIGQPIPTLSVYVLDKYRKLAPLGIVGELYVGGKGLSRGYLNNAWLTREKFIDHPYKRGERLYGSGDLVKWLGCGDLEYMGRLDHQVKVRGFRVELGEIEARLLSHDWVNETVVAIKGDETGEKYICAYIVSAVEISAGELKDYLLKTLPYYMVPSYFFRIESVPLTFNGKIDRNALPGPASGYLIDTRYVPPRNETEKRLAAIWQDLLNEERIGIDDDFFSLGGHSLKAIQLIAQIHKIFNVDLGLNVFFDSPNIREIAQYLENAVTRMHSPILPVETKSHYPLSSAQKRLYILHQLDERTVAYHMFSVFGLEGKVDRLRMESAAQQLIQRHESLRTSFLVLGDEPVQKVHDTVAFGIEYVGAGGHDQIPMLIRPFDLATAPLMRVGLIKEDEGRHILVVDMHHIISDGMSIVPMIKDFMELYAGRELPVMNLQYKDYAQWQIAEKEKEKFFDQRRYWEDEFGEEIPVLNLPADYSRPLVQDFEGSIMGFGIGPEATRAIKAFTLDTGTTLYMALLAIYTIFLSKLSGQEDIVVGTPVAGRRHADLENIIGMFVNTLPMRNYPAGEKTYNEFLDEIKTRSLAAFENQDVPYEELVEGLSVPRDVARNPLFDTMFVMQNTDSMELEIGDLKLTSYPYENRTSKFDLTLLAKEEEELSFTFEYRTKLFKSQTIERFITYFKSILHGVIENVNRRISDIEILTEAEKNRILYGFNCTEADYPKDKTIHELFEEQVEKTPDYMALIGSTAVGTLREWPRQISYQELNKRSDQLAYELIQKGVQPDSIVAINVPRCIEMIMGILGILKAGGAYLPLNPDYPRERIDYMLRDSGAALLLTSNNEEVKKIRSSEIKEVLFLDPLNLSASHPLNFSPQPAPGNRQPTSSLAYVIYTSGSTGKPKGVMIQHPSVVNFIKGITDVIPFKEDDIILSLTAVSFDIFGLETILPFTKGSTVVIGTEDEQMNAEMALNIIEREKVTIFQATPSRLQAFVDDAELGKRLRKLRYVIVGGETLTGALLEKLKGVIDGKIYHVYGPTETTIWSSIKEVSGSNRLTIGKPLANTFIAILNRFGLPQPIGTPGELCIGGDGLARGYLNNPELTFEKFIGSRLPVAGFLNRTHNNQNNQINRTRNHTKSFWPHLFSKRWAAGGILYKTGDLARWLEDGNIEFLGRMDTQVKIRGFRIELGEIENQLRKCPGIKEALVGAREDKNGDKYLCAYTVSEYEYDKAAIREFLCKTLPDYMIPSYFVQLDRIPLTMNGKIDRKALPEPVVNSGDGFIGPRDELEKKLVFIWHDVLNQPPGTIGIDNNFFSMGGHSLKATAVVSKIQKELNVLVPLTEIFKRSTVRRLAEYIRGTSGERFEGIEPVEDKEYYELSSAQKRLYRIHRIEPDSVAYNLPVFWELHERMDPEILTEIFRKLVLRHEMLRTSFRMLGDIPVQRIHDAMDLTIFYYDAPNKMENIRELTTNFIRPFDLSHAPLLRVGLIKNDERHILLVDMHHIITDGISLNILMREFLSLHSGMKLPLLSFHYRDFAEWQKRAYYTDRLKTQEEYWLRRFQGEIPVLNLPTDYPRPAIQRLDGHTISSEINVQWAEKLRGIASEQGGTLYMVLLAVFTLLLAKYTNRNDIIVGSPVAGRRTTGLESIIGMFVNVLLMRNTVDPKQRFEEFLENVKSNTLQAFENQDYSIDQLAAQLNIPRDTSRNPLYEVIFALTKVEDQNLSHQGLELKPFDDFREPIKTDLRLGAMDCGDQIMVTLTYSVALFNQQTAENMLRHYQEIMEQVVTDKKKKIEDFQISQRITMLKTNTLREEESEFDF
ncbi:MAG: amino acid adenylation domain-containing protein [Candidatus Omnitrophota bacterium]